MDYKNDFDTVRGRKIQNSSKQSFNRFDTYSKHRQFREEKTGYQKSALKVRTNREIKKHHQNKQKARRLFIARVRAVVILIIVIIVVASILLLTPLCDIKNVVIEGNQYVSTDQISQSIGNIVGTNLITASKNSIQKSVKSNKYIDSVSVGKALIPPTITINVTEYIPVGYIQVGDKLFIVDKNLYIIEESADQNVENMVCVTGCSITKAEVGKTMTMENDDLQKSVETFLEVMSEDDTINHIRSIDFSEENNITFNYDDRITANCGSSIEFEKKLRLFRETVKNASLGDTAKGTIDLTTIGKAIYTP